MQINFSIIFIVLVLFDHFTLEVVAFRSFQNQIRSHLGKNDLQASSGGKKIPTKDPIGESFLDIWSDSLDEITTPISLKVDGKIPSYLCGSLIRNGCGIFGVPETSNQTDKRKKLKNQRYTHVFDGLSKLTRYNFDGKGNVQFSTQFLKSDHHEKIISSKQKLPPSVTLGPTEPPFSLSQNVYSLITSATSFDNTNVNIHRLGKTGSFVAVTDAPVMMEFNPVTLETIGKIKFQNRIVGLDGVELFSTAHPKSHKNSGNYTYNYFLEFKPIGKSNLAHIVRTDSEKFREIVGTIEVGKGEIPYVHDFSLTGDYVVLFIYPIRSNLISLASGKGFLSELKWYGDDGVKTKIYVFDVKKHLNKVDKKAVQPIAEFESDPIFAYHHINAYEEKDNKGITNIIVDLTAYEKPGIINGKFAFAYLNNMNNPNKRKFQERDGKTFRWKLPLFPKFKTTTNYIKPTCLHAIDEKGKEWTSELLSINPNYQGLKHRYTYSYTGFAGHGPYSGGFLEWAIVKHDIEASNNNENKKKPSVITWSNPSCYPSEVIFVPSYEQLREDDGVLLSQVYDGVRKESFLLVLDATTLQELARCYTGIKIPMSFHGNFYTDDI